LIIPTSPPELIILVGGNGAGKSSYFDLYLKNTGVHFVNADLIAKDLFGEDAEKLSLKAARIAEDTRNRLLQKKKSFCFETVFSHPSKIDFLAQAKAQGYQVKMIALYTESIELNIARVAQRVAHGGHAVPEDKVAQRIPRTYENIVLAMPLCDQFVLLDNSSAQEPFRLKLAIDDGEVVYRDTSLPEFIMKGL
jgi:predicted ABC-type ATPase